MKIFLSVLIITLVFVANAKVPVYVMLPLKTVTDDGKGLVDRNFLSNAFERLKNNAGLDGIMVDVWWGIVERNSGQYTWDGYLQLMELLKQVGLKAEVVMSFHQCGGNVGDDCNIPIPQFVRNVGNSNPDIYYTDRAGHRNPEYISLGSDDQSLFSGRTPIQMYRDFMSNFKSAFSAYMGSTIIEIQVGLGPAGEMRYPSYWSKYWSYPGVGEFQCYDKYLLANLKASATSIGHPEWGNGGPHDAGNYNSRPYDTPFFNEYGGWDTDYGRFFLGWYSSALIQHGSKILNEAKKIFSGSGAIIAAKISGIHWWYYTRAHASELAAGYYNTILRDGYKPIAQMFSNYSTLFDFTCLEMRNSEQAGCNCNSAPEQLVGQTRNAAWSYNLKYGGENALARYDDYAYDQMVYQSNSNGRSINGMTYLRLDNTLLQNDNFSKFTNFINRMHSLPNPPNSKVNRVLVKDNILTRS